MKYDFKRNSFYALRNKLDLHEVKNLLNNLFVEENISNNFIINDISSMNIYRDNSLLFLKNEILNYPENSNNICFIIEDINLIKNINLSNYILVNNLENSYNLIVNHLYQHDDNKNYKDEYKQKNNSYISISSKIEKGTILMNNCTIGKGVEIGKNCIIKNNVIIKNAIIGDNVTISDNTVIGSSGFGFDLKNMGSQNITPQIGIVHIDDNAHIGASCTVDRAKIDVTYIGKNSMIDNMVHIGHNVIIGKNACIAAQTGISGSVIIGDNLISGGQSGYAGHISIGNNVIVAAKSGVTKNIKSNSTVAGFPAIDIKEWKKRIIREKINGHKSNKKNTSS